MLKKNYALRAAALLFAGCMFCLCTIAGTVARYALDVPIRGTAARAGIFCVQVSADAADWVTLGTGAALGSASTGLGPLYEEDLVDFENVRTAPGSTVRLHVDPADGTIIAPGTGGKLSFVVRNLSEVPVWVWLERGPGFAEPTNAGIAFSGNDGVNWRPTIEEALADTGISGFYYLPPAQAVGLAVSTPPIHVWWKWPFEIDGVQDSTDTGLGTASSKESLAIFLLVKAEQAD